LTGVLAVEIQNLKSQGFDPDEVFQGAPSLESAIKQFMRDDSGDRDILWPVLAHAREEAGVPSGESDDGVAVE
jgi:hypothetical protein